GNGIGLVILPGGAQTRVGAHRQHVLLARSLAERGIATLRFEGRGMGDSEGVHPGFAALGPDIAAAVQALRSTVPGLDQVILYGLCDAAAAIALGLAAAAADGAILLNPWVRSEKTLAATRIRTHYPRQALSAAFWKKLLSGQINPWAKLREILATIAASRQDTGDEASLADQLHAALAACDRPLLLLLSGRDMTAAEFEGEVLPRLQNPPLPHLTVARISGADHTLSQAIWWRGALDHIEEWLDQRQQHRANRAGPVQTGEAT
ncbi:MAG TPA: hydrolase 1, exosortase A system-associated, partial [Aliidongia sp.]|uniref:hydrolase 1, exosortase A system-associated n=1 Tax=Aliidongia sp. TaxID=1914230 RepID=UPI002DDDA8BC